MSINDRVFTKLGELGYVGSLPDRILGKLNDDYGASNINEGFYKAGGLKRFVSGLLDVSYVARLDGVSQYWQLSDPIVIPSGSDFKVSGIGVFSPSGFHFASSRLSNDGRLAVLGSTQNVYFNSTLVDGITNEDFAILTDGNPHHISFERVGTNAILKVDEVTFINGSWSTEEVLLDSLGSKWGSSTSIPNFEGPIYDFKVEINGELTNAIPLTNREQGATQSPTIGSVSATMFGYSEGVWEIREDGITGQYVWREQFTWG
tara:strand:+ start:8757 stop:9539 length:783 start_codon:yes stop_codon:yes gene_type:complete